MKYGSRLTWKAARQACCCRCCMAWWSASRRCCTTRRHQRKEGSSPDCEASQWDSAFSSFWPPCPLHVVKMRRTIWPSQKPTADSQWAIAVSALPLQGQLAIQDSAKSVQCQLVCSIRWFLCVKCDFKAGNSSAPDATSCVLSIMLSCECPDRTSCTHSDTNSMQEVALFCDIRQLHGARTAPCCHHNVSETCPSMVDDSAFSMRCSTGQKWPGNVTYSAFLSLHGCATDGRHEPGS